MDVEETITTVLVETSSCEYSPKIVVSIGAGGPVGGILESRLVVMTVAVSPVTVAVVVNCTSEITVINTE